MTLTAPATQQTSRIGALLTRGGASIVAGQIAVACASLIATPFVLRLLGPERYGMLILIGVITGSVYLADLGMGLASTRFAAQAYADDDAQLEIAVVWTSTVVVVVPISLVSLLVFLASNAIAASAAHGHAAIAREGSLALKLATLGILAGALDDVWNTPQLVRLWMARCMAISAGRSVALSLLTPLVLFAGGGLAGAAVTVVVVLLVSLALNVMLAYRSLPGVLRPNVRRGLVRPLMRFGGGVALSNIASRIVQGGERMLLPHFASAATLAYFSVAYAPLGLVMAVPGAIHPSLLASFARLSNAEDRQKLYRRVTQIYTLLAPSVLALACMFAGPFFRMWAGTEYADHSTVPLWILSAGAAVRVVAFVPAALIQSLDRMDLIIWLYLAEIVPYLALAIALIGHGGAVGAAIAWSLRATVDGIILLYLASHASGHTAQLTRRDNVGGFE